MTLLDTVAMMNSDDFKERFKAEYNQVVIRMLKLDELLYKMENGNLDFEPKCSYELLRTQCLVMKSYIAILEERARIENINLKE